MSARFAPYRAVIGSRVRAQRTYRVSFALDLFGALLVGLVELGEMWVILHNVRVLGGLDFPAVLMVFGLSNMTFSLADMLVGHVDGLPRFIREGTLDAFYLRPQPVLAQLMTAEISLRRLSRVSVGAVAFGVGMARGGVAWDPGKVAVLALGLVAGTAIFAGVFVLAAGVQFFLIDGSEVTNSFTYGGAYASAQPASVFPSPLVLVFGFLVPVVFTGYLPVLWLLGLPGAALLPSWLAWFTPVAAAWTWLLAMVMWRQGTRHYQGAGG